MDKKLKLLVCFKAVRELDTVLENDWLSARDTSFNIDYTKKIVACFDESALETALCMADSGKQMGIDIETTALTISSDNVSGVFAGLLANLYAVGFSNVIHIKYDKDLSFNPRAIAQIITAFVKFSGGFDGILMGYQANVGNHCQTAVLVSEYLKYPFLNMIYDIVMAKRQIYITDKVNNGIRHAIAGFPAVLAFGNAKHSYLRIATLKEKLASSKKKPLEYSLTDLGVDASIFIDIADSVVLSMYREKEKRICSFIHGKTAAEKAHILFESQIGKAVELQ